MTVKSRFSLIYNTEKERKKEKKKKKSEGYKF